MVRAGLYKPPGGLQELSVQGVSWSPESLDDVLHSRWLELSVASVWLSEMVHLLALQMVEEVVLAGWVATVEIKPEKNSWLTQRYDLPF